MNKMPLSFLSKVHLNIAYAIWAKASLMYNSGFEQIGDEIAKYFEALLPIINEGYVERSV